MLGAYEVKEQSNYYFSSFTSAEEVLHKNLGDDFENVIGYDEFILLGLKFVKPIFADITHVTLVDFQGSPERKLNQAISYIKQYPYVEEQADPARISKEFGGNCQAFSLALKSILIHNGIESGIVFGDEHMYNWVNIEGKRYLVDVVDGFIKEG